MSVVSRIQWELGVEVGGLELSVKVEPMSGLCSALIVSGLYVDDPWEAEEYFVKNGADEALDRLASAILRRAEAECSNLIIMSDAVVGWDAANGMDDYMDGFNMSVLAKHMGAECVQSYTSRSTENTIEVYHLVLDHEE